MNKNCNHCVIDFHNAGHDIEILVASAITSKNIRTFDHIFEHVIHVAPHLATDVFVLLLDSDKATWNSARKYFCYNFRS